MNTRLLAITAISAAALFTAAPAEAAKKNKLGKGDKRAEARMLGRFDANHDGSLDATEAERVRKAFEALKSLDTDKDGKLSDSEITAAKVVKRKGRGGKRKQ